MIDVNEVRNPHIAFHGLENVNEAYTMYYDETNNIRRLRVTQNGLNVEETKCYVLGGIAHRGPLRDLEIQPLRSTLRIQETASEIKLKHIGKGEFLDLLGNNKMESFLAWMIDEGLFAHYQVLDVLYWSIVDIIDSIIAETEQIQLAPISYNLKDDLYKILRYDVDDTAEVFRRYSYPNVDRARQSAFVNELLCRLTDLGHQLPEFGFQMLKGVLQMATNLNSLPFLENEEPNILLKEFSMFYIKNICLFKNSNHILDIEPMIEERLNSKIFVDNGRQVENYNFVDSKNESGIQIADVVVGFIGKFFTFINQTAMLDLHSTRSSLSPIQLRNLSRYSEIVDISINENKAFANCILSIEDQRKAAYFLSGGN